ncbi:MAG TPA: hypothetical protein PK971_13590, partial [Saprospiraceae bacterium]|nr:hypothetical protein [Saprospiraceae bacterium]
PSALVSDYVTAEIAMAAAMSPQARISPVIYGVELDRVKEKPFIGSRTLIININQLEEYFGQLNQRVDHFNNMPDHEK